jgi:hypothetical protein
MNHEKFMSCTTFAYFNPHFNFYIVVHLKKMIVNQENVVSKRVTFLNNPQTCINFMLCNF